MMLSALVSLLDYFGNKEVSHDAYINSIINDEINLGGSIGSIYSPVNIAEITVEKGATSLLIQDSSRENSLIYQMI